MASILKVDAMQGVTSAGDITVTSEGGAATQSLQQGLIKAWANVSGNDSPVVDDSLNVTSISDEGSGEFKLTWVNLMGNTEFACLHGIMRDGNTNGSRGASGTQLQSFSTAHLQVLQMYGSTASSDGAATGSASHDSAAIIGDLA
jgi:hypothetical protein